MNKLLLKLALLPSGLWKRMGADVTQLRAMLEVKLMLDDRKPVNFGRQKAQKKNRRFSVAMGMIISFVTGLVYVMPLVTFRNDVLLSLSSFFILFLFLLTFTLISDFSSVLVDTRDKLIILPRPVNDRTLFLSRILHIFIYLFRIVLPMSLPGWILLGLMYGWKAAVWYPVPILLVMFTALFAVMGAYMMILRLASPQRFKDVLSYFQIAVSIIIFAMFYLAPRAINSEQMLSMTMNNFPWLKYFPPFWIAATWSWIDFHGVPAGTIWYSVAAVVFPILAIWVTVKFFAPRFSAVLGGMDATDSTPAPAIATGKVKKTSFPQRLAALLNKNGEAQSGFLLTWLQTSRSRSFKLKIYPSFAYVPIYFIYLMLQSREPLKEVWAGLPESNKHIVLLYMCSFVVLQALTLVSISEQYKAAWVYYANPVQAPGNIMSGSFKALWVKYLLPFFMSISIFILAVWGVRAITDVILGLINVTLFAVCMARVGVRFLPFSRIDQVDSAGGSRVLKVMVSMTVPVVLGVGHYLAMHFWWLKLLFMGLSGTFLWLVWDSYVNTKWSDLKQTEL